MPGRLNVATTEVIRLRPLFWDTIDDVTVCSFSGEKSKQNKYTKVRQGKERQAVPCDGICIRCQWHLGQGHQ